VDREGLRKQRLVKNEQAARAYNNRRLQFELGDETDAVPTADVAAHLARRPQSLSPARDALLKKGLIYSGERGRIAFTVPHFGRYLREHA